MREHDLHLNWIRNEMVLIYWFSVLHSSAPAPIYHKEIVFSQVYHGTIAVFRGDIHTHWAIPEKIQTSGRGWWRGIFRSIEKNCGSSRGQSKKKWNFQWCSKRNHVKFPWVLIFNIGISKECHTILQNF